MTGIRCTEQQAKPITFVPEINLLKEMLVLQKYDPSFPSKPHLARFAFEGPLLSYGSVSHQVRSSWSEAKGTGTRGWAVLVECSSFPRGVHHSYWRPSESLLVSWSIWGHVNFIAMSTALLSEPAALFGLLALLFMLSFALLAIDLMAFIDFYWHFKIVFHCPEALWKHVGRYKLKQTNEVNKYIHFQHALRL